MKFSLTENTGGLVGGYHIVTKEIKIFLYQIVRDYRRFSEILEGVSFERFAIGELNHAITHEELHKVIHDIEEKRVEYLEGEEVIIDKILTHLEIYPIIFD